MVFFLPSIYFCHQFFVFADINGNGNITKEGLYYLLKSVMKDNHNLNLNLSEEQMKDWVEHTFKEVDLDGNGLIDYNEYREMVNKHPSILNFFNINIEFMTNEEKEDELIEIKGDDENTTHVVLSDLPPNKKIGMIYCKTEENGESEEKKKKKSNKNPKAQQEKIASANNQDEKDDVKCGWGCFLWK